MFERRFSTSAPDCRGTHLTVEEMEKIIPLQSMADDLRKNC